MKASKELLQKRLYKRNQVLNANSPFVITDEILEHHYHAFQEPWGAEYLCQLRLAYIEGIDLLIIDDRAKTWAGQGILDPRIFSLEIIYMKSCCKRILSEITKSQKR